MELTKQQITEGNVKLAKLLGWFQNDSEYGWFEKGESAIYVAYDMRSTPYRDLPFHRDWNFLMKVVDKIGYHVYHREDDAPDYNWKLHYSLGELFHHMWNKWLRVEQAKKGEFNLMNNKETIWSACVAWYDWWQLVDAQGND
jgi:hypothetical protein